MPRQTRAPRAFTLIELLVVIVIISILIAAVLAVGRGVIQGGEGRFTTDTIRTVDLALGQFLIDTGEPVPEQIDLAWDVNGDGTRAPAEGSVFFLFDGVIIRGNERDRTYNPSMAVFIQAAEQANLGSIFSGIPERQLVSDRWDYDQPDPAAQDPDVNAPHVELRTIRDAWGNPLRFVHPAWDGIQTRETSRTAYTGRLPAVPGQGFDPTDPAGENPIAIDPTGPRPIARNIRRNWISPEQRAANTALKDVKGDSDGGQCPDNRPYIYSAGPDGDPSTLEDNIYTTPPQRPRFAP